MLFLHCFCDKLLWCVFYANLIGKERLALCAGRAPLLVQGQVGRSRSDQIEDFFAIQHMVPHAGASKVDMEIGVRVFHAHQAVLLYLRSHDVVGAGPHYIHPVQLAGHYGCFDQTRQPNKITCVIYVFFSTSNSVFQTN